MYIFWDGSDIDLQEAQPKVSQFNFEPACYKLFQLPMDTSKTIHLSYNYLEVNRNC